MANKRRTKKSSYVIDDSDEDDFVLPTSKRSKRGSQSSQSQETTPARRQVADRVLERELSKAMTISSPIQQSGKENVKTVPNKQKSTSCETSETSSKSVESKRSCVSSDVIEITSQGSKYSSQSDYVPSSLESLETEVSEQSDDDFEPSSDDSFPPSKSPIKSRQPPKTGIKKAPKCTPKTMSTNLVSIKPATCTPAHTPKVTTPTPIPVTPNSGSPSITNTPKPSSSTPKPTTPKSPFILSTTKLQPRSKPQPHPTPDHSPTSTHSSGSKCTPIRKGTISRVLQQSRTPNIPSILSKGAATPSSPASVKIGLSRNARFKCLHKNVKRD